MKRKILMAAMGMDIGGAETHIAELSAELKRRGCDVIVASNGGAYVPMLERSGIRHFDVPMNRRAAVPMLKSLLLLRRIIAEEKPDIVHAHARIPAFLCSILHRFMKFHFITTTHGIYASEGLIGKLTSWGEKSIAVSEDVRNYLIKLYGIDPDNIFMTVNGIDTERFSPDTDVSSTLEESGIPSGAPVICHVSRLDTETSLVARQLIDTAPSLCKKHPGAVIVIIGGGELFGELSELADRVNTESGRRIVVMAGPRTDIDRILPVCRCFVGVSRAALEAMACSKPVILAGNQGYIGIFSPDRLEEATETNFCCRGCPLPTLELLTADIDRVFTMSDDERSFLGLCGRTLVSDRYSVSAMADSCAMAYDSLYQKEYRVVMSGYYGFGNSGDEAILQAIHNSIHSPGNLSVTVLTNSTKFTRLRYGYNAVYRYSPIQVIRALLRCDALISGGGSLLQDHTSTRSLLYYLSTIGLAKLLGKKVMIYANGIGPVSRPLNRKLVRRAVESVDAVTLRDVNSVTELRGMGVTREDITVTSDPVFNLAIPEGGDESSLLAYFGIPSDKRFVAVSVRNWSGTERFSGEVAALCDMIYRQHGLNVVFFVMQPKNDEEITEHIRSLMQCPSFQVGGIQNSADLIRVIGKAELMIAMRLHAIIFSAREAVPTVGIVYDPKVDSYLEMLGMPSVGGVGDFNAQKAFSIVSDVLRHRDETVSSLRGRLDELKRSELANARILKEMLAKPSVKNKKR